MNDSSDPSPALTPVTGRDSLRLALSAGLNLVWVGGALSLGALLLVQIMPARSDLYLYKAMGLYLLLLLPLAVFLRDHRPHTRFGPANTVTLIRAAIVCLLASLYGERWTDIGLLVTVVAIVVLVLDGVDGWLARSRRMQSAFGARFDMETDAMLVLVLALLAWQSGKAGAWVLLTGLMRYAFAAAMLVWRWLARPLQESLRRKTVCILQASFLVACVAPILPDILRTTTALAAVLLVTWSFGIDIRWLASRRHMPMPAPPDGKRRPSASEPA